MRQSHCGLRLSGVMRTRRSGGRDSEHLKAPGRKDQVAFEHLEPDRFRPVSSVLEDTGVPETSHVEWQSENDTSSLLFGEQKEKRRKEETHSSSNEAGDNVSLNCSRREGDVSRSKGRKTLRGCRSRAFRVSVTPSEENGVGIRPRLARKRRRTCREQRGARLPLGRACESLTPALVSGAVVRTEGPYPRIEPPKSS